MYRILMFLFVCTLSVGVTLTVSASEKGSMMKGSDGTTSAAGHAMHAVAEIKGTEEGSAISGTVTFMDSPAGVKVVAKLSGIKEPGEHGFHVHQYGSCGNGGKAAGGHFNPRGTKHGFFPEDGENEAHYGDMGNVIIGPDGSGALALILPKITISGDNGIAGRAVILHAKADDFGQPTGNAGDRIACGTIAVVAGK